MLLSSSGIVISFSLPKTEIVQKVYEMVDYSQIYCRCGIILQGKIMVVQPLTVKVGVGREGGSLLQAICYVSGRMQMSTGNAGAVKSELDDLWWWSSCVTERKCRCNSISRSSYLPPSIHLTIRLRVISKGQWQCRTTKLKMFFSKKKLWRMNLDH